MAENLDPMTQVQLTDLVLYLVKQSLSLQAEVVALRVAIGQVDPEEHQRQRDIATAAILQALRRDSSTIGKATNAALTEAFARAGLQLPPA